MSIIKEIIIQKTMKDETKTKTLKDQLIMNENSISYEYVPKDSDTNKKWSYTTNSPMFQKRWHKIVDLLESALAETPDETFHIEEKISFTLKYEDGTVKTSEHEVPSAYYTSLFREIRQLVPKCESIPDVLHITEHYEN